jgi:hypothetical protein
LSSLSVEDVTPAAQETRSVEQPDDSEDQSEVGNENNDDADGKLPASNGTKDNPGSINTSTRLASSASRLLSSASQTRLRHPGPHEQDGMSNVILERLLRLFDCLVRIESQDDKTQSFAVHYKGCIAVLQAFVDHRPQTQVELIEIAARTRMQVDFKMDYWPTLLAKYSYEILLCIST